MRDNVATFCILQNNMVVPFIMMIHAFVVVVTTFAMNVLQTVKKACEFLIWVHHDVVVYIFEL